MTSATHAPKNRPKTPTQRRSRARFELILDHTERLLRDRAPEELSIYDVAASAGMAAQSVYRLFPSASAILFALAARYQARIIEAGEQADFSGCACWQDYIEQSFGLVRDYYNAQPQALDLLLGAGSTREIRSADRQNIQLAALRQLESLAPKGAPALPVGTLEIAIDIADAIWSRSYDLHETITPAYQQEVVRAVTAYLELYLPRYGTIAAATQSAEGPDRPMH